MTKLYCPKGHANKLYTDIHQDRLGKIWDVLICNDSECYRPYFAMDCLTEPLAHDTNVVIKNSNSVEFDRIKTDGCEHDLDWSNREAIPFRPIPFTDKELELNLDDEYYD